MENETDPPAVLENETDPPAQLEKETDPLAQFGLDALDLRSGGSLGPRALADRLFSPSRISTGPRPCERSR